MEMKIHIMPIMPNTSSAMEWNEGRNEIREGRKRGRKERQGEGGETLKRAAQ